MDITDLVRNLRTRTSMTQTQFAKALRLTRGAIAAYETGQTPPSFNVLGRMAKLSGLTVSDLLTIPTIKEAQDKTAQDTTARQNLEICLNSYAREMTIMFLAYFSGRSPRASK